MLRHFWYRGSLSSIIAAPYTGRLRRSTSDEPPYWAHSRRAAGTPDVLEASICTIGISGYPGIYRKTQNKQEKIERGILVAMTVVVLSVVSQVFQGIEIFVFNFPPAPATGDKGFDIVLIGMDIGELTLIFLCLAVSLDGVINKINVAGPGGSV